MAFHKLEDNQHGFLQGAQINMANFQIRTNRNQTTRLHRLDLVDIFSLTPRTDFFNPLSWRVYTGLETQSVAGVDELVSHVSGGVGVSYELWRNQGMKNKIDPSIGILAGFLHHFASISVRIEYSDMRFDNNIERKSLPTNITLR
jgi:hypothetical protein